MHDITFAREIIAVIKDKSKSLKPGVKITKVNVALSTLSHVEPDGLKKTFSSLAEDVPIQQVDLCIKSLSLNIKCKDCGYSYSAEKPQISCPKCSGSNINIKYPREFSIESIEVEE